MSLLKSFVIFFIFCIEGCGSAKIIRILTEQGIPTPTVYILLKGRDNGHKNAKLHRWGMETTSGKISDESLVMVSAEYKNE